MSRPSVTGCHAAFSLGERVRIVAGTEPVAHPDGCFEALIEMSDGHGQWIPKLGYNTFFPPTWSDARIRYEAAEAFKQGRPRTRFKALSPGGVVIQFEWDESQSRTCFYPLQGNR